MRLHIDAPNNSMNLIWITDPHLDHVPGVVFDAWVGRIRAAQPDSVVITGDISVAEDVVFQLHRIESCFGCPVHFVLGNHDFYGGSIDATRRGVEVACERSGLLNFLTTGTPVQLSRHCWLIGDDGWCDGTVGDFDGSPIQLNDFYRIADFDPNRPEDWKSQVRALGRDCADRLAAKLDSLPNDATHVVVATHLPPWRDACWYEGRIADDDWAPFFVCGQVGQVIVSAAKRRTNCHFHVLCGHTHHSGIARPVENVTAWTGPAVYAEPGIAGTILIESDQVEVTFS